MSRRMARFALAALALGFGGGLAVGLLARPAQRTRTVISLMAPRLGRHDLLATLEKVSVPCYAIDRQVPWRPTS